LCATYELLTFPVFPLLCDFVAVLVAV